MKLLLTSLALLALLTPLITFGCVTTWTVSGAGSGGVNGTYSLLTTNSFALSGGGTTGMLNQAAYSLNGLTASAPVLVVTSTDGGGVSYNASELRGLTAGGVLDAGTGYYYTVGQSANPTNYAGIDTRNASGVNPIPTITSSVTSCSAFGNSFLSRGRMVLLKGLRIIR